MFLYDDTHTCSGTKASPSSKITRKIDPNFLNEGSSGVRSGSECGWLQFFSQNPSDLQFAPIHFVLVESKVSRVTFWHLLRLLMAQNLRKKNILKA